MRSGAGSDDIAKPKLWCFDDLLFLREGETVRESISSFKVRSINIKTYIKLFVV